MAGLLSIRCGKRAGGCAVAFGLALAFCAPASASETCMLCSAKEGSLYEEPATPLSVEIETTLDFDRVALSGPGGGMVTIDAISGRRSVSGDLVELGGVAVQGTATVRGEPGRAIRIQLPAAVTLHSGEGGSAELSDIEADLPRGGARLGRDGTLRFSFGGRLTVKGDASGDYRGRIPLVVDYQ